MEISMVLCDKVADVLHVLCRHVTPVRHQRNVVPKDELCTCEVEDADAEVYNTNIDGN